MFGFITTNLFSYENMQLSNFVKLVPELIDVGTYIGKIRAFFNKC